MWFCRGIVGFRSSRVNRDSQFYWLTNSCGEFGGDDIAEFALEDAFGRSVRGGDNGNTADKADGGSLL